MIKKLFFLLLMSSLAFGQSLLVNGGFESGKAPWGYYQAPTSGAKGTFSITDSGPFEGSGCAHISMTSGGTNIWDAQVSQSGFSVTKTEIYKLTFYVRGINGAQYFQAGFVQNSDPYQWYDGKTFPITSTWKKCEYVFTSPVTTDNDIQIVLQFAKNAGDYFFDNVLLEKTGTMPQVADDWYQKAEERIEQIRKGDFTINVKKGSVSLPACSVKVSLKQGEFKWGTCLALRTTIDNTEAWYRKTASEYFNYGVFENVFKWQQMEPSAGNVNYSDVDNHLKWADSVGWEIRGHTLVWGGERWLPTWVMNLPPSEMAAAVKTRITRDLAYYKGKIAEYDIVNEPIHETYLADKAGDSINTLAFKWAREANPDARLYINEYSIITGSDGIQYKELIQKMIKDGAPIDGIGVQGHFQTRVDWKLVASRLNYIAEIGLPIKVTEFDIDVGKAGMSQAQMAEDFAKIMRITFSHPSVTSFLFWGFWDGRHWLQDAGAGLFDISRNKRAAADSVYNLIHNVWTTKKDTVVNSSGSLPFRGFYGNYDIKIFHEGVWKQFYADFMKGGLNTITLDVDSGTTVGINKNRHGFQNVNSINKNNGSETVTLYDLHGRAVTKLPLSDYYLNFRNGNLNQPTGKIKLSAGTYCIRFDRGSSHSTVNYSVVGASLRDVN